MNQDIIISQVNNNQTSEVIDYVISCRKILFPTLDHTITPKDLKDFYNYYQSTSSIGVMLQARNSENKLIGVIAMLPYDDRFEYLGKLGNITVEVARLFVDPMYRKTGVGSLLFQHLERIAKQRGIDKLYLHTHPFLEGALTFWEKQGFSLIDSKMESGFLTLHMIKSV